MGIPMYVHSKSHVGYAHVFYVKVLTYHFWHTLKESESFIRCHASSRTYSTKPIIEEFHDILSVVSG